MWKGLEFVSADITSMLCTDYQFDHLFNQWYSLRFVWKLRYLLYIKYYIFILRLFTSIFAVTVYKCSIRKEKQMRWVYTYCKLWKRVKKIAKISLRVTRNLFVFSFRFVYKLRTKNDFWWLVWWFDGFVCLFLLFLLFLPGIHNIFYSFSLFFLYYILYITSIYIYIYICLCLLNNHASYNQTQ